MHIILIGIILVLLLLMIIRSNASNGVTELNNGPHNSSIDSTDNGVPIAFLSNGKLFYRTPENKVEQVNSQFIQDILDSERRSNSLHGWKKGTSFDSGFLGKGSGAGSEGAAMTFRTAEFVDKNTVIYFLSDGHVGGIFEQDLETGEEKRLLHQQRLDLDHFHYDAENDRILCSSGSENGIRNLASFDRKTNNISHYTEGDTIDAFPFSYPGDSNKIVIQSAGIGRSEDGYMAAIGPTSLNILSTDTQNLEPVVDNERLDFLHPVVHPTGDLYYIQRPYEMPKIGAEALLLDILLFPFRIARAIFHYLNFFSLMYSQKPLTSAAGPKLQRERKEIVIQGKRIDAEKSQRQAGLVRGIPSLVPKSWQLISRNRFGQEQIVANNVLSYDISSSGKIIYTNGFGVFEHTEHGPVLLFRDTLIEKVLVN